MWDFSLKQFFIQGVDYQPGGSSGFNEDNDPLSDINKCVRDAYLFQKLGINTIRVYSISTKLNHDKCMSLFASLGIYVVLDVNTPLRGQHLNRYEPWTTYTSEYLDHIFKVSSEFSGYNNTLAYFIGNEIVNDPISAKASPIYIKALTRDVKEFLSKNNLRQVPVGYSAADDLSYRISLAKYLACYTSSPFESVDFYGVNSYQWCGKQTFESSGYNILVNDYKDYSKPIFFSEYGCNVIQPRIFGEVKEIYSTRMASVFSGGLVYEFAQESNNYGLVDYDSKGDVHMLKDFFFLKDQITNLTMPALGGVSTSKVLPSLSSSSQTGTAVPKPNKGKTVPEEPLFGSKEYYEAVLGTSAFNPRNKNQVSNDEYCEEKYINLEISDNLPVGIADHLIQSGISSYKLGKFVSLNETELQSTYKIYGVDGSLLKDKIAITISLKRKEDTISFKERIWGNSGSDRMSYQSFILMIIGYFSSIFIF